MIAFLLSWLAMSAIIGSGLALLIHKSKLRDQRKADGVNWSIEV